MANYVKFYKSGDSMGMETNARDEGEFMDLVIRAWAEAIQSGADEWRDSADQPDAMPPLWTHDLEFQLGFWLNQVVDVCCKYRGYKAADVRTEQVLKVGQCDEGPMNIEAECSIGTSVAEPVVEKDA